MTFHRLVVYGRHLTPRIIMDHLSSSESVGRPNRSVCAIALHFNIVPFRLPFHEQSTVVINQAHTMVILCLTMALRQCSAPQGPDWDTLATAFPPRQQTGSYEG